MSLDRTEQSDRIASKQDTLASILALDLLKDPAFKPSHQYNEASSSSLSSLLIDSKFPLPDSKQEDAPKHPTPSESGSQPTSLVDIAKKLLEGKSPRAGHDMEESGPVNELPTPLTDRILIDDLVNSNKQREQTDTESFLRQLQEHNKTAIKELLGKESVADTARCFERGKLTDADKSEIAAAFKKAYKLGCEAQFVKAINAQLKDSGLMILLDTRETQNRNKVEAMMNGADWSITVATRPGNKVTDQHKFQVQIGVPFLTSPNERFPHSDIPTPFRSKAP